jgi:septal ring factor EnvC (AmiA/AmiB activator)
MRGQRGAVVEAAVVVALIAGISGLATALTAMLKARGDRKRIDSQNDTDSRTVAVAEVEVALRAQAMVNATLLAQLDEVRDELREAEQANIALRSELRQVRQRLHELERAQNKENR